MTKPQKEREKLIEAAVAASKIQVEIKFKKQKYKCKQITVDEDNLIYRVNNTRVGEDLEVEKAKNNKTDEHFSLDREENEETQKLLHVLLKKYIGTLDETYEREGELDPIWIDPKGRVLNGNRRLRFYRDIYKDDITCIVLQDGFLLGEGKDLEIEAEQDAQKEDKKQYKWTSWGLNLKKLRDRGDSLEEIANDRSMTKNEVNNYITGYVGLKNWLEQCGWPGRFDLVPDKIEQIWLTNYPMAIKRKNVNESDKDIYLFLAGLISFAPAELVGTRRYDPYKKLVSNAQRNNLIKNLKINISDAFVTESGEFGKQEDKFSLDAALQKIKKNEGGIDVALAGEVYEKIKTTKANQDDLTADAVKKKIILASIDKINSLLETVLPHLNNYDDLEVEGAEEKLKAVEEKITKLKDYIKDHS